MNDPRSSNDPDLKAALKAWDEAGRFRDKSYDDAMRIRTALYNTTSHQAYGWAALTCGRIAAHRQQLDLAEILLTEALGRFCFVGDKYGENMAISHFAVPHVYRRNLDRALELALKPLSSETSFSDEDKCLLHNVATQCYWAREDSHPAIIHLMKAYALVKTTGDYFRKSAILGNMGLVLSDLGEWDLSLAATTEAWQIQLDNCCNPQELQLTHLANLINVNLQLENLAAAMCHAELLFEYLKPGTHPASWMMFDNMATAFAFGGRLDKARYCLERARHVQQHFPTAVSKAAMQITEAVLLETKREYHVAVALANEVLEQPAASVMHTNHRQAALVLSRSYAALGRKAESAKWKKFAAETGREKLLGDILSSQLRASLNVEQPTEPLTDQELTCLSLSAHGQTSADIALKLGIKPRTVNFHFTNILRKLNAMNRQEAIAKASEANLLRRP